MSKKQPTTPTEPFERLRKNHSGIYEDIKTHALDIGAEISVIDSVLKHMKNASMNERVVGWAKASDLVGAATGIQKLPIRKSAEKEKLDVVSSMAAEIPEENNESNIKPATLDQDSGIPDSNEALINVYRIHADMEERDAA